VKAKPASKVASTDYTLYAVISGPK